MPGSRQLHRRPSGSNPASGPGRLACSWGWRKDEQALAWGIGARRQTQAPPTLPVPAPGLFGFSEEGVLRPAAQWSSVQRWGAPPRPGHPSASGLQLQTRSLLGFVVSETGVRTAERSRECACVCVRAPLGPQVRGGFGVFCSRPAASGFIVCRGLVAAHCLFAAGKLGLEGCLRRAVAITKG